MTYVGATPTTGDFKKLDSITTSSATTFNLRHGGVAIYPQSANHCIVSLNGVIQAPVDSFTIVNDTIVFASSLAGTDVINFILVLGNVNDIGVPSSDTVDESKLKVSNSPTNGYMLTAQSAAAGGLTWAAQPSGFDVSSITGATAIGAIPANDDEFVMSDGGTLKRIDYKYLVPYGSLAGNFSHGNQTGISSFSYTKILLSSENYNRGLTFGSNKITIPSGGAGDYMVSVSMAVNLYGADKMQAAKAAIYINGSGSKYFGNDFRDNPGRDATIVYNDIIQFNDSDEIEIYAYIGHTQSTGAYQAANNTSITLFKVNNA